jgi:hypothetical protein
MEHSIPDLVDDRQEEALRRLCSEAEVLLRGASSAREAFDIRDALCSRLTRMCPSAVLSHGARLYVDRILEKYWPCRD